MSNKPKLNTKDESLGEILSNGKKYFVPKFQRDYSWETEQLEDLWDDINLMGDDDYHYMGYLVIQGTEKNTFKIIDGQQRLTTFSLLVLAASKRLREMKNEKEREEELYRNFIGTKNIRTLEVKNKLTLNRNNNYHYKKAIKGKELPKRGEKNTVHLMAKAMNYFYENLKNKTGEEIGELIEKTSSNFLFTTIYIGDEINAYKVFETLNARGVQLSSGDLLKNYIFTCIDEKGDTPESVIEEVEEKWSQIGSNIGNKSYAHYILAEWNSYNKLLRKKYLFKEICTKIKKKNEADDYLTRLEDNSRLYSALNNSEDEFWKDHENYIQIKKDISFLKLFNIKQPLSLLLISHIKQRENFTKILKWIIILSFRYNVIGNGHAGDQEKLYNEISLKINKHCKINEIKEKLLTLYPSDEKFKLNFTDKTMPTKQSNQKARYILARLEEKKSGSSIDETKLSLEHILPLNPNDKWCDEFGENWQLFNQRLGNMALVDNTQNKLLGQKDFSEKKKILNKTTYAINNLNDYKEWDSQTIESRQKAMAKLAAKLWSIDN